MSELKECHCIKVGKKEIDEKDGIKIHKICGGEIKC